MVDAQIRLRVIPVALQVSARSWSVQVLLFFPNRRGALWTNSWRRGSSTRARGAPDCGLSVSPSSLRSRNLRRHLPTVSTGTRRSVAMAMLDRPPAAARMILARSAIRCAVVGRRDQVDSVKRSSSVSVIGVKGRPAGMGHLYLYQPHPPRLGTVRVSAKPCFALDYCFSGR